MLTTDQKGNIAEAAIVFEAIKLGIDVYRPVGEGGRSDMLFHVGSRFLRVPAPGPDKEQPAVANQLGGRF